MFKLIGRKGVEKYYYVSFDIDKLWQEFSREACKNEDEIFWKY